MSRPLSRSGESGETLIELIVAVSIMATVISVAIGALTSVVAGAEGQRTGARGQTVLNSFAELAKATPLIPCATADDYNARLATIAPQSARYKAQVKDVAWWDGTTYRSDHSTLSADVDAATTTINVANAGVFTDPAPPATYTIKVGTAVPPAPPALPAPPELMTVSHVVSDASGTTLTVTRAPGASAHVTGDPVTLCPPPDNHYNLQLLDLTVTGPQVGIAGGEGAYSSTLSVAKRGPLLIPTLTPGSALVDGVARGTGVAGDTLSDSAVLSYDGDARGVTPSGTLTFKLFGPDDPTCTGDPVYTRDVPVTDFGSYPAPDYVSDRAGMSDGTPGQHRWIVSYGGDSAFQGASSVCDAPGQVVQLDKKTPALTATASLPTAQPGDSGSDTAELKDAVGPDPDGDAGPEPGGPRGTITFELHGPDDADCSDTGTDLVYTEDAPVKDNGSYTLAEPPPGTPDFTFQDEGTYHWIARYSGDANNEPVATPCELATQAVAVSTP